MVFWSAMGAFLACVLFFMSPDICAEFFTTVRPVADSKEGGGFIVIHSKHNNTFLKFLRQDIYTQHCFLISRSMLFLGGGGCKVYQANFSNS